MIHLPSVLEIELLSDCELIEKIDEVQNILSIKKSTQDDDRDEQELYQLLETERIRRQLSING